MQGTEDWCLDGIECAVKRQQRGIADLRLCSVVEMREIVLYAPS